MSDLGSFVKRLRDIMRNDAGINGDAQRIEQIAWMLFLKVYDSQEENWEFDIEDYESIIPEKYRWRNWAIDDGKGTALTGDRLLNFVNNELFPTLKGLEVDAETPINKAIVKTTFEDANQYMKDGVLLRQVLNIIDGVDFGDYEESHAFGDIYETILKELQSAGSAGEFYTPRAVTDFMAEMIEPQIGESMADFACGTGGFLVSWIKKLQDKVETTEDADELGRSIYGIEKKQFQKSFTDDHFNRHINHGEKSQYYMKDHHEALVSRDDFEAANAIIDANGLEKGIHKDSDKYNNRYPMSGKIVCGECGNTWKRVKLGSRFGFACNTHVENKNQCSMMSIKEAPVQAAFATMMNKLTFARSSILIPYSEMIKGGNDTSTLERIDKLDELLEINMERRQQIMQFFSKGLLDPAVYAEESDMLSDEECRLSAERDSLSGKMSGSYEKQEALAKLLKYTAKGRKLRKFDGELFTEHVDHIVVFSRTEIGFAMKCGPVFRERI